MGAALELASVGGPDGYVRDLDALPQGGVLALAQQDPSTGGEGEPEGESRVQLTARSASLEAVWGLDLVAPELWNQIGIYSAGLKSRDTEHPIIVAGIQSVYRRATELDAFSLQTSSGTDTATSVTVSLAAGTAAGLGLVEITSDDGLTVYGSVANPAADTVVVALGTNITATTASTQYKVRVTPRTHAAMPAPPG